MNVREKKTIQFSNQTKIIHTMKNVLHISVGFFLTISFNVVAQTHSCGHQHYINMVKQTHPGLISQIAQQEADASTRAMDNMANGIESSIRGGMPDGNLHIPVVFHIFHDYVEAYGVGGNIEYDRVLGQMEALNFAFSGGEDGVDTHIRFCLAQEPSPGTQWTDLNEPGVMRYANDQVIYHDITALGQQGLLNITHNNPGDFPFDNYLNIWSVQTINSGVIGYSPLPILLEAGGTPLSELDGVVMINEAIGSVDFGNTGMNGNYEHGNVLVNEVGHYLRLWHTFQPDLETEAICAGMSDIEGNPVHCLEHGDFLCDTPPQDAIANFNFCSSGDLNNTCTESVSYSNWGIPPFVQFVDGTQTDAFDMYENYMAYPETDECMQTFTEGQAARMEDYIETSRAILVSETNLIATGVWSDEGCFGPWLSAFFEADFHFACVGQNVIFDAIDSGQNQAVSWE